MYADPLLVVYLFFAIIGLAMVLMTLPTMIAHSRK